MKKIQNFLFVRVFSSEKLCVVCKFTWGLLEDFEDFSVKLNGAKNFSSSFDTHFWLHFVGFKWLFFLKCDSRLFSGSFPEIKVFGKLGWGHSYRQQETFHRELLRLPVLHDYGQVRASLWKNSSNYQILENISNADELLEENYLLEIFCLHIFSSIIYQKIPFRSDKTNEAIN